MNIYQFTSFSQYVESKYPNAEQGNAESFKFIQPDGVLRLSLETPQAQKGWIVQPKREPMEVCACYQQ